MAGPAPSFISAQTLDQILADAGARLDGDIIERAFVRVDDPEQVEDVQRRLSGMGYAVNSVASQMRALGGLFQVLSGAVWVCGVLMVLGCLGLGAAVGSSWVRQRRREIGLLRAIGWERSRVGWALLAELALLGAVAGLVGIGLGILGSAVGSAVLSGQNVEQLPVDAWQLPPSTTVLLAALLVPLCVCLGGLASILRASRVDPDEALRDL